MSFSKEKKRQRRRFGIMPRRRRNLRRTMSLDDVNEQETSSTASPFAARSLSISSDLSLNDVIAEEQMEFDADDDRSSNASTFMGSDDSAGLDMDELVGEIGEPSSTCIQEAMQVWVNDTQALLFSEEMSTFLHSSGAVLGQVSHMAVHAAMLPVTVPIHIVSHSTGIVGNLITSTYSAVDRVLFPPDQEFDSPVDAIVHVVVNLAPLALHIADQVKNEIGATILGLLSPPPALLEDDKDRALKKSPAASADMLDRLRLDYPADSESIAVDTDQPREESPEDDEPLQVSVRSPDVSKFLLRVCDLGLVAHNEHGETRMLHCIDLSKDFAVPQLTHQALDSLVAKGLALVCTNSETRIGGNAMSTHGQPLAIDWKPEGATERHLKKRTALNASDWIARLSKHVLVWSGKFRERHSAPHGEVPIFLSRGILPMSPKELLHLFWDNDSCHKYNKFCLGRISLMTMEDDIEETGKSVRGTKIVRSETQVPFTGMSVVTSTIMHARKLDMAAAADSHCYMIVSRTLNPGKAGVHFGCGHSKSGSKNEILWAVNLIRSVPGKPSLCELTALSQVKSGLVPHFLVHRVGVMAVDNCFNALRSL